VIAEAAGAGDPNAARARLDALESFSLVGFTAEAGTNAAMRAGIEGACRRTGFEPPAIRTPNELPEVDDANNGG